MTEKAEAILERNYIGTLASVDEDGSPRSTPVHMAFDGRYIYWLSTPDKIHSKNIARDPRVHLSVFSPDTTQGLQGVYVKGEAEALPESEQQWIYRRVRTHVGGDKMPGSLKTSSPYRLPIGTLDEQKSTGNCWYFYS